MVETELLVGGLMGRVRGTAELDERAVLTVLLDVELALELVDMAA